MKNLSPPWLRIGNLTSINDFFCSNALLIAPQQYEVLGSDQGHMVHSHVTSVPLVASLFLLTLEENVAYFGKITDLGGQLCHGFHVLGVLYWMTFFFIFWSTSASSSFRDSYGFIRGARESESELFHFLCRELKQHYSSFYQVKYTNLCGCFCSV